MNERQSEDYVLDRLVPELVAEGYDVYRRPGRDFTPDFMGDYLPDAVALRSDKNIAIEILRDPATGGTRLEGIAKRFVGRKDWQLRLIGLNPENPDEGPKQQDRATIARTLGQVRRLLADGQEQGALLLAWSAFEATARCILPQEFGRPQTSGRLIETLAHLGYILPSEADRLRPMAAARNSLAHGVLDQALTTDDVAGFAEIVDGLLMRSATPSPTP